MFYGRILSTVQEGVPMIVKEIEKPMQVSP
jgi:hypothetical protein